MSCFCKPFESGQVAWLEMKLVSKAPSGVAGGWDESSVAAQKMKRKHQMAKQKVNPYRPQTPLFIFPFIKPRCSRGPLFWHILTCSQRRAIAFPGSEEQLVRKWRTGVEVIWTCHELLGQRMREYPIGQRPPSCRNCHLVMKWQHGHKVVDLWTPSLCTVDGISFQKTIEYRVNRVLSAEGAQHPAVVYDEASALAEVGCSERSSFDWKSGSSTAWSFWLPEMYWNVSFDFECPPFSFGKRWAQGIWLRIQRWHENSAWEPSRLSERTESPIPGKPRFWAT